MTYMSIQLTADVPSNYSDGRVPILDLKCLVAEVETEEGKHSMILHEHYVKAVSSKTVIHRNSAMSLSSKRTILTQQCLRIMLNCNTHIGWEKISEHLSFYTARMLASGYDHSLRLEIVSSAIGAYNKMKEADGKEEMLLYRKREWRGKERRKERRKEKRKEKDARKNKWYKKG